MIGALSHYARHSKPVTMCSVRQEDAPHVRWDKPFGLWVSVDGPDDWHEWASENMPGFLGRYHHRVALSPDANILCLTNSEQMFEFDAEYGSGLDTMPDYRARIDWARVSEKWQGIVITPYQWAAAGRTMTVSLGLPWYYGWDCASGCVWDADAIETVALLGETHER